MAVSWELLREGNLGSTYHSCGELCLPQSSNTQGEFRGCKNATCPGWPCAQFCESPGVNRTRQQSASKSICSHTGMGCNKSHCWLRPRPPLQCLWKRSSMWRTSGAVPESYSVFQSVKHQSECCYCQASTLQSRYPSNGSALGCGEHTFQRKTVKCDGFVEKASHTTLNNSLHQCRVNTRL